MSRRLALLVTSSLGLVALTLVPGRPTGLTYLAAVALVAVVAAATYPRGPRHG